jgi:hypothetical protein
MRKEDGFKSAKLFIDKYFPTCLTSVLAGSVVRGEATERSDLDIVIIDDTVSSSYRESLYAFGWPIEVFVHNKYSYKAFFEIDCKSGRPSMPRMISEGIAIKQHLFLETLKAEANQLLGQGPEPWDIEKINIKRYFLTDMLDDFEGSTSSSEDLFIANALSYALHEFILRVNCKWIGNSKWIVRALNEFDKEFCNEFVFAFEKYYRYRNKYAVIELVDQVLKPYGGRLFDGFSIGKN